MGVLRLILLILLAALLYRMLRRWLDVRAARRKPGARDAGRMLACAHCGVYFPEQDAVRAGGHVYCSEAHRLAHRD
jgi:uncharacterized protein